MRNSKGKLSVGILIQDKRVSEWEFHFVEKIHGSSFCNVRIILLQEKQAGPIRFSEAKRPFLFTLFRNYKRHNIMNDALKSSDTELESLKLPFQPLRYRKQGDSQILDEKDLEIVEAFNFDVIVNFAAPAKIPEKLFSLPCHGLWSYKTFNANAAVPKGFWESLLNYTTVDIVLYRLDKDPRKISIIHRSASSKFLSVWEHVNRIHWKKVNFLFNKLEQLYRNGELFYEKPDNIKIDKSREKRINRKPTNINLILPLARYFFSRMTKNWYKKFFIERWVLLYSFNSNGKFDFSDYKKIIPPRNTFWADPFVVYENDKYYIFFESCPTDSNFIGTICCMELDENGNYTPPVTILEKPYHLSYPFVFQWDGDYYMIPETYQDKNIQLYKCTDFPYQWEFEYNLMDDIIASDVTIFFMNDRWWLFTVIQNDRRIFDWTELYIFYADSPVSKEWTPHALNPVISNVQSARPAGKIFRNNGSFFRPSQDCSARYGYGVRINQILKLTPQEYQEKEVTFLEPNWDKKIKAIHTYNQEKKLTVIDGELKSLKF